MCILYLWWILHCRFRQPILNGKGINEYASKIRKILKVRTIYLTRERFLSQRDCSQGDAWNIFGRLWTFAVNMHEYNTDYDDNVNLLLANEKLPHKHKLTVSRYQENKTMKTKDPRYGLQQANWTNHVQISTYKYKINTHTFNSNTGVSMFSAPCLWKHFVITSKTFSLIAICHGLKSLVPCKIYDTSKIQIPEVISNDRK